MTAASIPQSIFELPVEERITLADRLYASVPAEWQRDADHAGWRKRNAGMQRWMPTRMPL